MKQPNIVIIDYSVGNIHSVYNAFKTLNYKNIKITNKKEIISDADFIILPGVGAFDEARLPVINVIGNLIEYSPNALFNNSTNLLLPLPPLPVQKWNCSDLVEPFKKLDNNVII